MPLWFELVPFDEVKGQLNALVQEWMHVAAYQKTLPFKPESSGSQVDSGESSPPVPVMFVWRTFCLRDLHVHVRVPSCTCNANLGYFLNCCILLCTCAVCVNKKKVGTMCYDHVSIVTTPS